MRTKVQPIAPEPDEDDWQTRDDVMTLSRAEAIKRDSERMGRVQRHIARMSAVVGKIPAGGHEDFARGYRRVG